MRWDDLFADLEAQSASLAARERSVEADGLMRAEVSRIDLTRRLGPAVGTLITVRSLGEVRTTGTVRRVGPDWILLDEGHGREAVLMSAAMLSVSGIGRLSAPAAPTPSIESRLGIASVLRALAQDRSPARLHLIDGSLLDGTLDRVGADFVEVAVHGAGEVRRRSEVLAVQIVPHRALSAVRRDR